MEPSGAGEDRSTHLAGMTIEGGSCTSFTALLELPHNQAMEVLQRSQGDNDAQTKQMAIAKPRERQNKKCKSMEKEEGAYVHLRARRGQATGTHSLAERARREKINARMKLLQEMVPGCNKISGTVLVLEEIINHVQSLQRQVEYLSMRLAAVNQRFDFNIDSLVAARNGSLMDSSYQVMVMPLIWPDIQMNRDRQQCQLQWHLESQPVLMKEADHRNIITPESSLLSYDSASSASLHPSQLIKES